MRPVRVGVARSSQACAELGFCAIAPVYTQVDEETCWRDKHHVPELGLKAMKSCEFRVYAAECEPAKGDHGPYIYIGVAHKSNIARRIRTEFEQLRTTDD